MTPKTNRTLILGLAALLCALLLPAAILAKGKPPPRPWEMQAYSEMVVSLPSMAFVSSTAWIDASHCGKSMAYAGAPGPTDEGRIIAANGDVIYFKMPISQLQGVITGGTGRFEGASGEFHHPDRTNSGRHETGSRAGHGHTLLRVGGYGDPHLLIRLSDRGRKRRSFSMGARPWFSFQAEGNRTGITL